MNGKIIKEQGLVEVSSIRPINIVLSELLNWKIVPDPNHESIANTSTMNNSNHHQDYSYHVVGIFAIINENYEYEFNMEDLDKEIMRNPFKIALQINRQLDGNVDQDIDPFFSMQITNPFSNVILSHCIIDQRYAVLNSNFPFTNPLDKEIVSIGNYQRTIKESLWSKYLFLSNELTRIMECQSHLRGQIQKRIEYLEELCEVKRRNKDPDYVAGSRKKCSFNQLFSKECVPALSDCSKQKNDLPMSRARSSAILKIGRTLPSGSSSQTNSTSNAILNTLIGKKLKSATSNNISFSSLKKNNNTQNERSSKSLPPSTFSLSRLGEDSRQKN